MERHGTPTPPQRGMLTGFIKIECKLRVTTVYDDSSTRTGDTGFATIEGHQRESDADIFITL